MALSLAAARRARARPAFTPFVRPLLLTAPRLLGPAARLAAPPSARPLLAAVPRRALASHETELTAADVLRRKNRWHAHFFVPETATVAEATRHIVEHKLGAFAVVTNKKEFLGIMVRARECPPLRRRRVSRSHHATAHSSVCRYTLGRDGGTRGGVLACPQPFVQPVPPFLRLPAPLSRSLSFAVAVGSVAQTARDLLHALASNGDPHATIDSPVSLYMTPAAKIIFAQPSDTLSQLLLTMSEFRIRNLPILDRDSLLGIVTVKDLVDMQNEGWNRMDVELRAENSRAPAADKTRAPSPPTSNARAAVPTLISVTGTSADPEFERRSIRRLSAYRVGVPGAVIAAGEFAPDPTLAPDSSSSSSSHASSSTSDGAPANLATTMAYAVGTVSSTHYAPHLAPRSTPPLRLRTGSSARPRARGRHCEPRPSEDAFFISHALWPGGGGVHGPVCFLGVADGVGAWRERGVDPTVFSTSLMRSAFERLTATLAERARDTAPPTTFALLDYAHTITAQREHVVGSATACIVTLDPRYDQIAATNIGDSGFIILRDASTLPQSGSLGLSAAAATASSPALGSSTTVIFRSPQQLHDFNQPFQLGYAPSNEDKFDRPADADIIRVPVKAGDLLILATDGLYDNLDEPELVRVVEAWRRDEAKRAGAETEAAASASTAAARGAGAGVVDRIVAEGPRDSRWARGYGPNDPALDRLATALANRAEELSTDRSRDSPFAILAKENDIMWSGGVADDITVLIARVDRADEADQHAERA